MRLFPRLYDTLEKALCLDVARIYGAGESNGGMAVYQEGVDLSHRYAAIAPQFGSFHRGFRMVPRNSLPLIDIHGIHDTTIPANVSLSGGGYYYTPVHEIFNGDSDGPGWKAANGCSGDAEHWPTPWDGIFDLYCILEV
eukprot:NODE_24277_length_631_cov_3.882937.p1 GENE.NODE_24277_length_631_cov_3.882937~~NODE_24277_length_631_cov_3.882937.p1  ORF type:complete len:139 (+),score=30.26 NODE_24277_length_631_cov_3.882937:122-538(+)